MAGLDHGLDSILTNSIDTPELDVSFDGADATPSSVSSGFLCLVCTVSDTSQLQLAPSFKSCKLFLPVIQAGKMSASKYIHYISGHPTEFKFWALCYQIISLCILPIRGLIRVFLTFRLALVQLLMPL